VWDRGDVYPLHIVTAMSADHDLPGGVRAGSGDLAAFILLVDPDPDAGPRLRAELAGLPHGAVTVRSVPGLNEALADLSRGAFDLVITEHMPPALDAARVTRVAQEGPGGAEVIWFTADDRVRTAVRAMQMGATDYLVKGTCAEGELLGALSRALRRRARRRRAQTDLGSLPLRLSWLTQIVDRMPQGVLVLDVHGRCRLVNRRARALIDRRDGLRVLPGGTLTALSGNEAARLRMLVAGAMPTRSEGSTPTGGAMRLGRAEPDQEPLWLLVIPLASPDDPAESLDSAVMVIVSDPEERLETTQKMLTRLYTLTPAEAAVTALVMRGKKPEEIASVLGIKPHTARCTLSDVYYKTHTRGQTDLVALLLSGPALFKLDKEP